MVNNDKDDENMNNEDSTTSNDESKPKQWQLWQWQPLVQSHESSPATTSVATPLQ